MSSRQLRAVIALVVVIGLAIVVGMGLESPLLGVAVLVIGIAAIGVVLKRTADADRPEREPRSRRSRADEDDHPGFEDLTDTGQPLTSRTRPPDAAEPLQTWTPPEPLQTWTPATNRSIEPPRAPVEPDTPWGTAEVADAPTDQPVFDPGPTSWDAPSADPLDDLDRLDDVDVVAEVERLDSAATASTVEPPVSPIKEDVETSDDILAASSATQLTIGAGDNTELARLLAKVQERLTAYE